MAGGVTFLSHAVNVTAKDLDDFLHGREPIPEWLFLRVLDYLNEVGRFDPLPFGGADSAANPKTK